MLLNSSEVFHTKNVPAVMTAAAPKAMDPIRFTSPTCTFPGIFSKKIAKKTRLVA